MSNAEGKFTVISSRQDDYGIPPGKYSVRVSKFMDKDGTPLPHDATQADYPVPQSGYKTISNVLKGEVAFPEQPE